MADALGYYNGLLGKLFDNGTPLPLRGGLNFVGFTIAQSSYGYTITANALGSAAASQVTNDSSVSGATVKDALNTNATAIAANAASIAAATASIAANTTAIGATGATGALAYNASPTALTRASHWFTDGTALYSDGTGVLTLGATASCASTGGLRLPYLFQAYVGTANNVMFGVGGTNGDTTWGGASAGSRYYDAGSGGYHTFRTDSFTERFQIGPTSTSLKSQPLVSATTINGARVAPPTQGTNLASGANNVNMSGGANYFMPASTTATASTVLCGATGAATGACLSFYVQAQAHNVDIQNASGTSLRTVTAGAVEIVDVHWDTSTSKYANPTWKKAQ